MSNIWSFLGVAAFCLTWITLSLIWARHLQRARLAEMEESRRQLEAQRQASWELLKAIPTLGMTFLDLATKAQEIETRHVLRGSTTIEAAPRQIVSISVLPTMGDSVERTRDRGNARRRTREVGGHDAPLV